MGCNTSKTTTVHVTHTYSQTTVKNKKVIKKKRKKKVSHHQLTYKPPIVYVWPPSAPCRAVLMATMAARVIVQVKTVDLLRGEHKQAPFLKINPEHKLPTLVTDDVKLWNSHVILRHVVDEYAPDDPLYPKDESARERIDSMLEYDEKTAYPAISAHVYPVVLSEQRTTKDTEDAAKDVLHHINVSLDTSTYVSGPHLTIADLSLHASLSLLELLDWDFSPWSALCAWQDSIRNLRYYSECNKGLEDWKFARSVKLAELRDEAGDEG